MDKGKQKSLKGELSSRPQTKAGFPEPTPTCPINMRGWTGRDDTRIVWDSNEWLLVFGRMCLDLVSK